MKNIHKSTAPSFRRRENAAAIVKAPPPGALTKGPDRKFPGLHPPSGGATSPSLLLNKRLAFPVVALLAALAVGLLFLLPVGPLQAQNEDTICEEKADKMGYECEYAENDTGAVVTFTATDPEGAVVAWSLDDTGSALFSISKDGVLSFRESPDYETPASGVTDNMYIVTVLATDDAYDIAVPSNGDAPSQVTTKEVTVEVTNEEEPGRVEITVTTDIPGTPTQVPVLQPQMEVELTATLSDGDIAVAEGIVWQWYRGSTEIIGATTGTGATSTYNPVQADIGEKLTAKATYMDGKNSNDKDMAEAPTIMAVRAAPSSNNAPAFPDEDPSTVDVDKTPKRKVAENTPAGRNIGAPVEANDQGDVLAYSVSGTLFAIDIATGQLKTKGKLNREAIMADEKTYEVTVTAVDPFGQSDTATVTIEIENEDERPAINERTAKTMLMYEEPDLTAETEPDPVLLWTYMAMDDEDDAAGPLVDLKWKLEGRDRTKLTIGNAEDDRGELKFMKNPDFEKPADANKNNVYEVTVVVTDSGRLTDTLAVRVEVTNAKEDGEVTFTVGTPRVGVPLTAMLEDPDGGETGHEWQWMVEDNEEDAVKTDIDGATSATFTPRDGDMEKFLSVKVKYTDGKGKDDVTQVLETAVAPSAAPRFYDKAVSEDDSKVVDKFELKLAENTEPTFDPNLHKKEGDIFVGHRTAAELLTYAVGGADASSFKVIPGGSIAAGEMVKLQAQHPLDREEKASYAVTVTATDSDATSATLTVTVTVTPIDEMPVVSGSGAGCEEKADKMGYECEYAENDTGAVVTFTATDPEGAVVAWSLDDTGSALFSISKDGVLSFRESPDYETPASGVTDNMYIVTVLATDDAYDIAVPSNGDAPSQVTTKEVTVEVTNEEEPGRVEITVTTDIPGTPTQVPVLQPQMEVELTATLSDGDTAVAEGIEWQWYRGSTEIIGATTGTGATSTYNPVESDIGSRLTAKATYMDGEDANNKKMAQGSTTKSVRRAPESNNAPAFPDEDPSTVDVDKTPKRKVAENTPAGRNIGAPVEANDQGDVLAYSVSGTLFAIDIATGQLKTKGKLNREAIMADEKTYEVTVTAVDPFGQSDTATVTIEIENEDERPAINERTAKTMLMYEEPDLTAETEPDPVLLWTYMAMDDEDDAAGPLVDLKWKLEGRDRTKLTIGNAEDDRGELKFMKNPDFEKPADANKNNVYEVTVVVTDSGRLTDTLAVRVEVTNAKEDGEVTFTVGTPRVGVPLTAMLEDPDGGETGHEWQWMVEDNEEDAVKTDIDGATSATFTPRDGDMEKFLSVKVKYTDGKGKDDVTQVLETAVAPSAAPRFYDKAVSEDDSKVVDKFELKLAENTEPTFDPNLHKKEGDIFVGHRTAAELLTYAVGGADASSFKVIPGGSIAAGEMVKLQAQHPLDREEKASYAVTVTATDSDGNSATLPVTVTVTPIDEMPAVMVGGLAISGMSSVYYAENGTDVVGTYRTVGPMADMASLTLEGDDAGDFMFSGGMLTFRSSPNYEMPMDANTDNTYMVTLKARDGTFMDTHDVMVMVTNVDELGMLVGQDSVGYMENDTVAVETYTANGPVAASWSLEGDDMGAFSIGGSSGELMFASPPDFEAPTDMGMDNMYQVTVMAAEAGGEMDMIDVTVTVTNEDEPGRVTFWRDGADATTAAIMVGDELGGAVDDSDGNPGDTFPIAMYTRIANVTSWQWAKTMTPNMMDSWMEIGTGGMYTVMDDDAGHYLRATAMYDDGEGIGKMASEKTMMVMMTTMNAAPMFDTETAERMVPENTAAGENAGAPVTAMDADNDTLTYSLGGTDMASFTVDNMGQIMVGAGTTLDADTKATYTVIVTATDQAGATDTIMVTITVTSATDYDANGDGSIDRDEVLQAVKDYLRGNNLTRDEVLEVIKRYLRGA